MCVFVVISCWQTNDKHIMHIQYTCIYIHTKLLHAMFSKDQFWSNGLSIIYINVSHAKLLRNDTSKNTK